MDEEITTILEPEELRRKYSQAERDAMPLSDFGDPDNRAFPIKVAEDVIHAASRLHNASGNQAAIKARIKTIARRKGFPLPQTWQDEEDGKGGNRAMSTDLLQAAQMYVPITRIDKDEWLIEGQATSDEVDHYNTIFDYESSKKAFQQWRGNIREMHQNKAVGRAVEFIPDDDNHRITLRARISRGAKDTWEKICDGTLSGFSIGVPKDSYKTRTVQRNGKSVLEYYDHGLAEVSVVDNPGSPGCDIAIVRADGMITDVLDDSEVATPEPQPEETRAGAALSAANRSKLHAVRDSAMQMCADSGCDECRGMIGNQGDDGSDRNIEALIGRALAPTIQRFNASLAQMAIRNQLVQQPTPINIDTGAIERRLVEIEKLVPGISEVRSLLSEVKEIAAQSHEIIERVEKQPLPGGPITNGAAMDKILATQSAATQGQLTDADVISRAAQLGLLTSQESQIAGATVQIAQMLGQH